MKMTSLWSSLPSLVAMCRETVTIVSSMVISTETKIVQQDLGTHQTLVYADVKSQENVG